MTVAFLGVLENRELRKINESMTKGLLEGASTSRIWDHLSTKINIDSNENPKGKK